MKAELGLLNPSAIFFMEKTSVGYLLQAVLIGVGIRTNNKKN